MQSVPIIHEVDKTSILSFSERGIFLHLLILKGMVIILVLAISFGLQLNIISKQTNKFSRFPNKLKDQTKDLQLANKST